MGATSNLMAPIDTHADTLMAHLKIKIEVLVVCVMRHIIIDRSVRILSFRLNGVYFFCL